MKTHPKILLPMLFLGIGIAPLTAQEELLEAVENALEEVEKVKEDLPALPVEEEVVGELPAIGAPDQPVPDLPNNAGAEGAEGEGGAAPFEPLEDQKREMEQTSEGYIIKDAGLNDIFQFLAKSAGRQYFHNLQINGPEFMVTGHLDDGDPLNQMEELAFMYGLSLHTKGNTIYALSQSQLSQLPSSEWHYQLQYLRPTDIEQIKELIKPMLTPGTGIVNFEPKTNTIIVIDTATRIEAAKRLLQGVDKPKGQIVVETKILRINSDNGVRQGVDWTSLGSGVGLNVSRDLNSIFGLGGDSTASNLVLSPVTVSGVLRALNTGNLANQVSNPTLITEDNEQATISIIDRIPIITSTTTPGGGSGPPTVSEEVRYKVDSSDKAITEDPRNHREIGISLVVTPTLLPDGTIRMQMRPRSAQITGFVIGQGSGDFAGNRYPQVTESMVETLARVPDGYSLLVGGFYGEIQSDTKSKVPGFGDLPIINFFFKSKEAVKEQTSLVFIVTPKSYNPLSGDQTRRVSANLKRKTELGADHNWADPYNPGPAHEPNLRRTLRGMQPAEAPYYPRQEELKATSYEKKKKPRFSRARRH
ncbi:MAG: type II secretion system protein GspD [Akkermansiaceae bacterium]